MSRPLSTGFIVLVILAVVTALSCSKSKEPPTAPPPDTPECSLDRSRLDFGSVIVGETKDLTFRISNTGAGALSGFVQAPCTAFTLRGDSTYNLAAGSEKTFTIRFAPIAVVAYSCTLQTGSTLCANVIGSGSGAAPIPACQIGPAALTFGPVEPFCSKTLTLGVTNVGTGTLSGTLTSSNQSFAVEGDPCQRSPKFPHLWSSKIPHPG